MLIEHMSTGLSFESFAGVIGVARDTLYEWRDTHEAFSDSIMIGKSKSLLFWEQKGILGTFGELERFNASSYIFTMKNKHGYRDVVEQDVQQKTTVSNPESNEIGLKVLEQLQKLNDKKPK